MLLTRSEGGAKKKIYCGLPPQALLVAALHDLESQRDIGRVDGGQLTKY